MNYMGGLTLQRAYKDRNNGSRRNLLVVSIMDLQYVRRRKRQEVQVYVTIKLKVYVMRATGRSDVFNIHQKIQKAVVDLK